MNESFSLPDLINDFHHDFRSVLSNLVGYVDHLLEGGGGPLTPMQEESLGIVLKNAHRLKLMADNLVRSTQEDAIHLATSEMFDLRKTTERSMRSYSLSAQDAEVKMKAFWEVASFLVPGSDLLAGSLIDNLLSNAIKFTPPGGRITLRGKNTAEGVELVIEDTGCGISPEDLPRIFERGFRGITPGGERRQGLGLGLSICQRIAQAHGAKLEATSQAGKGTRIRVVFPSGI